MRGPRRATVVAFLVGVGVATLLATGNFTRSLWLEVSNRLYEAAAPVHLAPGTFGNAVFHGYLEDPVLKEVSGLAVSHREGDLLWAVNDSGAEPRLHALGRDGRNRGSARIEGAYNRDWEGLVSIEYDGKAYLVAGEIGDNLGGRGEIFFFGVEEPALVGERFPEGFSIPLAFRVKSHYEDGARDAEAFDFDVANRRFLVLSKRINPPQIYEIPLVSLLGEQSTMARRVGSIDQIPQPTTREIEDGGNRGRYRSQPTALDLAADGSRAVILTYGDAYEFIREPGESWEETLAKTPRRISLPPLDQAEAAALDPVDGALWVTSERRPSPLFRLPKMLPAAESFGDKR